MIAETIAVFLLNSLAAVWLHRHIDTPALRYILYAPLLLFQGLWYYRLYIVGHEAAHRKLFSDHPLLNDTVGTLMLVPLLVPLPIYRKIHYFHHGFNRKDAHTSALDNYVVKGRFKKIKTAWCYMAWYLGVFFGGFYVHSVVSVLLFLFLPPAISVRISPAFEGWTWRDQSFSVLLFAAGISCHLTMIWLLGWHIYCLVLGFPMLSFAWVLSLLVYIFHYDTTMGHEVRYHVRSLDYIPVMSWILLHFNEHATHHQYPHIPWYELPTKRKPLPETFRQRNQRVATFWGAILQQLKGPQIWNE